MFWHDIRLSVRSIRRNPIMTALIVAAMAVGIGTSVMAIALYHAKAGNPIWWKNDVLFRPMLDSRPADPALDKDSRHPDYPPLVLIYRDAAALYHSEIPAHSLLMHESSGRLENARSGGRPADVSIRLTTRELFGMFDVPFLYGSGWQQADDDAPTPVAVISRRLNAKLFKGENSVGRDITLNGQHLQMVGVINDWMPLPRFYDAGTSFAPSNDIFIPFTWAAILPGIDYSGYCQQTQMMTSTFKESASQDCLSTGLWVELDNARQHAEYQRFLDNYAKTQQSLGRFPRPLNNRLANVSTWLTMNDIIDSQSKLQVILAFIFLGVCILNALGLLLAKFLSAVPLSGLRRALGATRADIVRQHVIEVMILAIGAGVLGFGMAYAGLRIIRYMNLQWVTDEEDYALFAMVEESLTHIDGKMIGVAVALSLVAGLMASVYPAWRIGRISPASFLKIQ